MDHRGEFILQRKSGQYAVRRYATDSLLIFFEADAIMGIDVYVDDEWKTLHYHPGQARDDLDALVQLANIALKFREGRASPSQMRAVQSAAKQLAADI